MKKNKSKKTILIFVLQLVIILFVANFIGISTLRFVIFGQQSCMTQEQVNADSRCLYILNGNIYEKGTRSKPHHGHACGSDVSSAILSQPFHQANPAFYLDPNLRSSLCQTQPTQTPTPQPTNTLTPTLTPTTPQQPTLTTQPTSTSQPTSALNYQSPTPSTSQTTQLTNSSNAETQRTPTTQQSATNTISTPRSSPTSNPNSSLPTSESEKKPRETILKKSGFGNHAPQNLDNEISQEPPKTEEILTKGTTVLTIFGSISTIASIIAIILFPK